MKTSYLKPLLPLRDTNLGSGSPVFLLIVDALLADIALSMRNKLINSITRNLFENVLILDNISLLIVIYIIRKIPKKII